MAIQKNIENSGSSELIIYQNPDGKIKIDVRLQDDTVWLTQEQLAILFERDRTVILRHIANISQLVN
jgi:hypothetical protein